MSLSKRPDSPAHSRDHQDVTATPATEHLAPPGTRATSAALQGQYLARDIQAGIITGAMAIPLTVGIALMSDYPIKVALATVAFACFIGWINAFIRPGNFIGAPGVAAGLAPVLAMGVASFGMENMAFVIFLTAAMQALIWKFNWQKYILLAVPGYLVEGLLAGVGLKIALKFLTFTYELPADQESADAFWNGAIRGVPHLPRRLGVLRRSLHRYPCRSHWLVRGLLLGVETWPPSLYE